MNFDISNELQYRTGIYGILNLCTDQFYVGSSYQFKLRFRKHKSGLYNNRHHSIKLQNAFNKYGDKNFVFGAIEVMEKEMWEVFTEKEVLRYLLDRERYWIDNFNAFNDGYNMLREPGTTYGHRHSKETKDIISKSSKRNWENNRETIMAGIYRNSKPVLLYEYPEGHFIAKFDSVRNVKDFLNEEVEIANWNVHNICNRKKGHDSNRGFTFRWFDENDEFPVWLDLSESEEVRQKRKEFGRMGAAISSLKRQKACLMYDRFTGKFIERFDRAKDAAKKYNVDYGSLIRNMKNEYGYAGGYIFKNDEVNYPLQIEPVLNRLDKEESIRMGDRAAQRFGKAVIANKDKEKLQFKSSSEAARYFKVPSSNVSLACRETFRLVRGYSVRYVCDLEKQ